MPHEKFNVSLVLYEIELKLLTKTNVIIRIFALNLTLQAAITLNCSRFH